MVAWSVTVTSGQHRAHRVQSIDSDAAGAVRQRQTASTGPGDH